MYKLIGGQCELSVVMVLDRSFAKLMTAPFRSSEVSVSGLLEQAKLKRAFTLHIVLLLRKQNILSILRYIIFYLYLCYRIGTYFFLFAIFLFFIFFFYFN